MVFAIALLLYYVYDCAHSFSVLMLLVHHMIMTFDIADMILIVVIFAVRLWTSIACEATKAVPTPGGDFCLLDRASPGVLLFWTELSRAMSVLARASPGACCCFGI